MENTNEDTDRIMQVDASRFLHLY